MQQITLLVVILPLLAAAGLYGARNLGGEVATLYSDDASGRTFHSPVWVIESGHELWIRSVRPTTAWLDRIINQPTIELLRGAELKTYHATPLAHRRSRINALMAERYGWAEWLLAKVEDREQAIPVYLDPFG